MAVAEHVHAHGYSTPVPRWSAANAVTADSSSGATAAVTSKQRELLIHRIPASLKEKDIFNMLTTHTNIIPMHIDPITRSIGAGGGQSNNNNNQNNDNGKTCIRFTSANHCNLAFETISGPNRPDKSGQPQKRVYLKTGGYICVRKFV